VETELKDVGNQALMRGLALKTTHLTDLDSERHGEEQIDAAQRLKRSYDQCQRPSREGLFDYVLKLPRDAHRLDHLLERDLTCWLIERCFCSQRMQTTSLASNIWA
jgi:hypothetical protein